MAAPAGNQFWKLRAKHGRDKLFASPELLWEAATEYFEWCDANPFLESEQLKQTPKAYKKEGTDEWIQPSPIIGLPKPRPYTLNGLCIYLDVSTSYFKEFKKTIDVKDFLPVITRIEETIYEQKFAGAAAGFFNGNIIARDLGLANKEEVKHEGDFNITLKLD